MGKMKAKLLFLICFTGLFGAVLACSGDGVAAYESSNNLDQGKNMQIKVEEGGKVVIFELNNSPAAKDLYGMLPIEVKVQNYADNEKIFSLTSKLNTSSTPLADSGVGTLAYFAPWGNVVMYYGDFSKYNGLYMLGSAVSGKENIEKLSGTVKISVVD